MSGVSRDYYAGRQRGLAEGEERAIERIIKLLEDDFYHDIRVKVRKVVWPEPLTEPQSTYHAEGCVGCHAITLIKGEK